MLYVVIAVAWLVAGGLALYLATHAVKRRLLGRRLRRHESKKVRDFKRRHHFDEHRERWVRNIDGAELADDVADDQRFWFVFFGWVLLVLWEAYWFFEIAQRFSETSRPLELPYVFLLFILVGLPLAVYLFFRRRLRRSVRSLPLPYSE